MPIEHLSEDTLTSISGLQFSKFLNVAALAIFVFDYCLTFSSEVEYVWGTKWEMSRILFTLSRYLAFIASSLVCYAHISAYDGLQCGSFVLALEVFYIVSILSAGGILILRTYALWGRSKKALFFLLFLAVAFIAGAEIAALQFKLTSPIFNKLPEASGIEFYPSLCAYRSSRNNTFQLGFLVAYEIILQSMSSWRKFRTYRNLHSNMLNTLYWDGIVYMWWIILLSGADMAVTIAAPTAYISALDTAQVAIHGVLASRIFFNLRECDKQIHSSGDDEVPLETLRCLAWSTVDVTTQISSRAVEVVHVA